MLDPADAALKRLMVPVLARELGEGSPTSRLAREAGQALLAAGYHQQVPVREGFLNLFAVVDGQRRALGLSQGVVEVRGTRDRWPIDDALRRLEADPSAWSPGALLRPLVQDALLPTAAYVGGPAEIAYHAQITPSYAHFGIPRPVLLPRPSLTLVEPPQARVLDAERLTLADLVGDPEALVSRWAREDYPDVEAAFARAREAIERELGGVEEALGTHDPTLRAATASARGRALHQVEGLHEKALRALKKRDQGRAERLRRTRDALVPGGRAAGAGARARGRPGPARPVVRPRPRGAPRPLRPRPPGGAAVRVGIVCYPTVGGSGAVAAELGKQLARRGHDIHVISTACPSASATSSRTSASTRWTSRATPSSSTPRTTSPSR